MIAAGRKGTKKPVNPEAGHGEGEGGGRRAALKGSAREETMPVR